MCLTILILLDVGVSGLSDQKKTRRDKFIMFFVGVRAGHRLSNTVMKTLSISTRPDHHTTRFRLRFHLIVQGHGSSSFKMLPGIG